MKRTAASILSSVGRAFRPGRSFTLIETLVAVGALAFVATGIAVIFEATGKTIATGKRVSAFNSYAALIQERLRGDFARMTRDGFLVVRNEYATDQNGLVNVPLYDGDTTGGRKRRIDELMFFAKGEFVSARQPLVPGIVARSSAARIYYGHGMRRKPDPTQGVNDPYIKPPLDDLNTNQSFANVLLGAQASGNPNRFASDWTLLRQVTLLSPAQTSPRAMPNPVPTWLSNALNAQTLQDTPVQVALQPAASGIFRSIQGLFPYNPPPNNYSAIRMTAGSKHPYLASGLVDIATMDLPLIRDIVTTADSAPQPIGNSPGIDGTFFDPASNSGPDGTNTGVDGQWRPQQPPFTPVGPECDRDILARMHAWMSDALPALSDSSALDKRTRLRYEPAPVNIVGVLGDQQQYGNNEFVRQEFLNDQLMLSSANFLPRCTEFIVEWSFGKSYPTDPSAQGYNANFAGQLIWHGMKRTVTPGGSGNPVDLAVPYDDTNAVHAVYVPFPLVNGGASAPPPWPPAQIVPRGTAQWTSTLLIHGGVPANPLTDPTPVTSYFGYFDPNFRPDQDGPNTQTGALSGGPIDGRLVSPLDSASPTSAWPWPTMVRVTLSLADPGDPSIERTFQFVFDVPQEGGR